MLRLRFLYAFKSRTLEYHEDLFEPPNYCHMLMIIKYILYYIFSHEYVQKAIYGIMVKKRSIRKISKAILDELERYF